MSEASPKRAMTTDEILAAQCLSQPTYPVGSWDKRFARMTSEVLSHSQPPLVSEKAAPQIWRLFHRYRRQIQHPEKARLLALAEQLKAPDFRKLAALEYDRIKYEVAMKLREQGNCPASPESPEVGDRNHAL